MRPLLLCGFLVSCGTLGTPGGEPAGLPSSGVGPFRALQQGELTPKALLPYVFANQTADYREPSVVGTSTDPSSTEVWMYAVAHVGGVDVLVRTRADDARSFYGDTSDNATGAPPTPPVVLQASQAWEGGATGNLAGPSALLVGGQLWLYYAAAGGIGLAQSSDGLTFTRQSAPVLVPDATAAWETSTPHAPSVAVFPDGSWHMMYGAGGSIGEATSTDGLTWTRVAGNPISAPSAPVDPSSLPAGVPLPFDRRQGGRSDARPADHRRRAPAGARPLHRHGAGRGWRGWLLRHRLRGALRRFGLALPSAGPRLHGSACTRTRPRSSSGAAGRCSYVSEDNASLSSSMPFPAIAAGYAPATNTLPAPAPFPTTP